MRRARINVERRIRDVIALLAVVVAVDFLFFKNRFWERLTLYDSNATAGYPRRMDGPGVEPNAVRFGSQP